MHDTVVVYLLKHFLVSEINREEEKEEVTISRGKEN